MTTPSFISRLRRAAASGARRIRPRYARRRKRIAQMSTQDVFTDIFEKQHWGKEISVSGKGSTPESTRMLSSKLPQLMQDLEIKTLFDAPCGDFSWFKDLDIALEMYIGADIVEPLIRQLQESEANPNRTFVHLDLLRDPLPKCDMIFCRDCMLHLAYADQQQLLENFLRTDCRYLMLSTYPGTTQNRDIVTGEARPVNLTLAPINFPEPTRVIRDEGPGQLNRGMGIWSREQLQNWHWGG